MLAKYLVHSEHVNLVLLEDRKHLIVAENLPLIVRVLEVKGLDMVPNLFNGLWTGKLQLVNKKAFQ
jgi:hypothetical protein